LVLRAEPGPTGFVQIASISGTTYTDTGLTPATLYRYQIKATDAAGDLSANATTNSIKLKNHPRGCW
jgi:chitodextrinase